jgi:hypothetical protein
MTVIAAFELDGHVAMFGDLLTTGLTPQSRPSASVPAVGDVTDFFGDSGWSILGLAQKVVIVTDHLVVAWTGWWVDARVVIAELRELTAGRRIGPAELIAFLQNHPDLRRGRTEFIVLIEHEGEIATLCTPNAEHIDSAIGRAVAAGSGTWHLRELMHQGRAPPRLDGIHPGAKTAVSGILRLAAQLLTIEHRGGTDGAATLRDCFGGGYEIALFDFELKRFRKLPTETTYTFWDGAVNGNQLLLASSPLLLIKQRYIEDALAIRSVLVDSQNMAARDHKFVVMPMYEAPRPTVAALEQTAWRSQEYCHCVLVRTARGVRFLTAVEFFRTSEPTLAIIEDQRGLGFEGIDRLHDRIRSMWNGPD